MTFVRARRTPTYTRLRRVRWTMTLVFAAASALCLMVLTGIALHIDLAAREARVDTDVSGRAVAMARTANFDRGPLDLGHLNETTALPGGEVFGVISNGRIVLANPNQAALPGDATLSRIIPTLTFLGPTRLFTAATPSGATYHWAAVTVPELGHVGAVVLVGGPVPGLSQRRQLIGQLIGTAAALAVVAAVIGHIISGLAMRPALRGIAQQEQFLLEASHELRTPLARLALILDTDTRDPALTDRDTITQAKAQTSGLGDLVSNLLLRARADTGRAVIPTQKLRLDQLAATTTATFTTDPRVHVDTTPTVVVGNPELLSHAIRNLVENALRYAPTGTITVSVTTNAVHVIDHGPGIPDRRRNSVRRLGVGSVLGTGTGLAIVEWVAATHHGRLQLGATPGGGLTATLTLPTP